MVAVIQAHGQVLVGRHWFRGCVQGVLAHVAKDLDPARKTVAAVVVAALDCTAPRARLMTSAENIAAVVVPGLVQTVALVAGFAAAVAAAMTERENSAPVVVRELVYNDSPVNMVVVREPERSAAGLVLEHNAFVQVPGQSAGLVAAVLVLGHTLAVVALVRERSAGFVAVAQVQEHSAGLVSALALEHGVGFAAVVQVLEHSTGLAVEKELEHSAAAPVPAHSAVVEPV